MYLKEQIQLSPARLNDKQKIESKSLAEQEHFGLAPKNRRWCQVCLPGESIPKSGATTDMPISLWWLIFFIKKTMSDNRATNLLCFIKPDPQLWSGSSTS